METLREIAVGIITFAAIGVWLYCLIKSPKAKNSEFFFRDIGRDGY